MSTTQTRRGDRGLGRTAAGGNGGSYASHERAAAAPPTSTPPASLVPLDREFESLEEKITAMSQEVATLVDELKTDEGWNRYLDSMSRFHRYSLSNQLLIMIQRPDATRVASKTTWASLGREVLPYEERGRRGISIFRPKFGYFPKTDKSGNPVVGDDGKPVKERRPFGFTTATVYDISETRGDALPDGGHELLTETPPEGLIADLESTIEAYGFPVEYAEIEGSAQGYTRINKETGEKKVVISSSLPDGDRARTLAHELGHIAAGHMDKTEEYHVGGSGRRGAMEIEADSIAHVMLRISGMNPSAQTSRYSAGWATAQADDPDAVKNAAATVQKVVKELVGSRRWSAIPDSGPQEKPAYTPKTRRPARKKATR